MGRPNALIKYTGSDTYSSSGARIGASRCGDHSKRARSSFFAELHQLADLLRSLRPAAHLLNVTKRAPRPEGVELLRLVHALQQGSSAGRMRQAIEVATEGLPRRDELALLPILHSPHAQCVDLIRHVCAPLDARVTWLDAAHNARCGPLVASGLCSEEQHTAESATLRSRAIN